MYMDWYLVTIRKHQVKDYVSLDDLQQILAALHYNDIDFFTGCAEAHGKYKQLHYHGLVRVSRGFHYYKYTKILDFRIHWKKLKQNEYMLGDADYYIFKHNPTEEYVNQTLMCNYYRYHYGFR